MDDMIIGILFIINIIVLIIYIITEAIFIYRENKRQKEWEKYKDKLLKDLMEK